MPIIIQAQSDDEADAGNDNLLRDCQYSITIGRFNCSQYLQKLTLSAEANP